MIGRDEVIEFASLWGVAVGFLANSVWQFDRVIADAGYRSHNVSPEYQFKVYTAGQKRRTTPQINRDMRRRAAVEPVIGHLKEDHRMGRNYLAHSSGDAINAVLAAVGYTFRLLLRWLRLLLFQNLDRDCWRFSVQIQLKKTFITGN